MSISKKLREIADELDREHAFMKCESNPYWLNYAMQANKWLPERLKPHFLTWVKGSEFHLKQYENDYHEAIRSFYWEFCRGLNDNKVEGGK